MWRSFFGDMSDKHVRRVTALAFACLLIFFGSGCMPHTVDSTGFKNIVVCVEDEFSTYPQAVSQMLPDFRIESAKNYPFLHLRNGKAIEALDAQALSALETGVAGYWYPQHLSTMVIAIDRDLTDVNITTWSDLPDSGQAVGFFGNTQHSYETLLSAISFGLEGEGYSLRSGAKLLAELKARGRLKENTFETPILLCKDNTAAGLIKKGRNLEIIVPVEGTLTFTKGLLSTRELDFSGDTEDALLSNGFRLLDGRADAALYPEPKAYENAHGIEDYQHYITESYDATRIMRRDVLGVRIYSSADSREHLYWVLLYIILVVVWIITIINRAVQKAVRRAALYTGITLIGWIIARLINYQMDNSSLYTQTFWYNYYIFQLTLPVVLLWLAFIIDKPEDRVALPKWMRAVHLINGILILLVLTNNLHNLVFIPNRLDPEWGIHYTYTYGFVFYLVQAGCWAPLIAGVVLLLYKGRHGLRKRGVLFLIALFGLLAAYVIAYEMRVPIAWESDYTMTVGVFILLLFETCIRSGIIPVSSKYTRLFAHSPLSMQINDKQGNAVLRSEAAEADGQNMVVFSNVITGGSVYWKEDISALVRLQEEIADSIKKLAAANVVLAEEEAIKRSVSEATARTQLMERLEGEISVHILRLSEMIERLDSAQDHKKATARITLLLCYIKRRCGLFFKEQEKVAFHTEELTLYMSELVEMAGYAGVRTAFSCELHAGISVRRATIFFDLFYHMLDWAAEQAEPHILASFGYESGAVLRLLTSAARSFQPDGSLREDILLEFGSLTIKEVDDDTVGISLYFPEGGERVG